ncbi:MAG: 3-phosphoshikimate 1-carboxyvinyltransferase [Peptococcaceae bacterium]|nr:3-phosphoshikimate 1-carboxyvinyltransferase [Peptococcaceae bacterium]MDH7526061.1 3-phosphoshikimate 1-carboxyvinyltransferase [Peptococcaceae bacterium]
MLLKILPADKLGGTIRVPGDKSISHRAVMLGALAEGTTEIEGFLFGKDCLSTVRCFRSLGVQVGVKDGLVTVRGKGLYGLREPASVLNVGNSGTTIRLLSGILAGQPFTSVLTGDGSIRRRPMGRVTRPLREMGAVILGREDGNLAPLCIKGGRLKPFSYRSPVASAQVKSALLLAGLFGDGWTEVSEPASSRNHTELMLSSFGARVETDGSRVRVKGGPVLRAQNVVVPGDISSAAFFIVAALIVPGSKVVIESVGLNPTRDGIIEVLQAMGAKIRVVNKKAAAGEVMGDLEIESSELSGVKVGGEIIPRLIDEIPALAVAALFAGGVTEIRDAAELKVKESNRIAAIGEGLSRLGGRVEELPDGLRIWGGRRLRGATCQSRRDHRIAMALAVAGLRAEGETIIENAEAISVSYPDFIDTIERLRGE